jgi:hypothetical protein
MPRRIGLLLLVVLLLAGLAVGAWFLFPGKHPEPTPEPGSSSKLVVLIVFDQMRGDYVERWAGEFGPDGFERIKKAGAWYSNAHLPYACSSTGPGHASIATGAPPSVTGIIENEWYDRGRAAKVYCVQPTREFPLVPPIPASSAKASRGEETGFSPEQLLPGATTVGDALHAASAGTGRVFSLSLKDRTAVLMGGRKPTGVYCFDTRDGKFHTGEFYRQTPHPWVEEFNKSGRVDKWFGVNWELLKPPADYDKLAGPDAAPGEAPGKKQGVTFPHPTTGGLSAVGPAYYEALEMTPFGDDLLFDLTKTAITAEKLGTSGTTDLLCVSFSSNDLIGHQWGPDSHEVMDVTLRSDRLIGEFLKFLDETVGPDHYVVVITADHGVCPIPEQKKIPTAARVRVADVVSGLEAALEAKFGPGPDGQKTRWLEATDYADRIWPWIFLNRKAIEARGPGSEKTYDESCEFAAEWLTNNPSYVLVAFTRKQIEANAPPVVPGREAEVGAVFERVKLAYHPARCGDVIAVVRPGVLVSGYPAGTSHGTPHDYDTHVPILVYGAGVPAVGKVARPVSSLIVAPTVARGLGIDPPVGATEPVPTELRK